MWIFGAANFSEVKKDLLYTSYDDEKERKYWKDKSFEEDYTLIKKQLPNLAIAFASSTADENQWLLSAYSDIDPGATYLYNRQTKKLTFQYRPRPNIPVSDLATMKAIHHKSSDGLEIPAYLTLPKGVVAKIYLLLYILMADLGAGISGDIIRMPYFLLTVVMSCWCQILELRPVMEKSF